jgi:hypothetical protein
MHMIFNFVVFAEGRCMNGLGALEAKYFASRATLRRRHSGVWNAVDAAR